MGINNIDILKPGEGDPGSQPEYLHHDENTLPKVLAIMMRWGLDSSDAMAALIEMQNAGILFRERTPT